MDTTIDIKKLFIFKRNCPKCYHAWFPRAQNPQRCPKCQVWLDKLVEDDKKETSKK